MDFYLSFFTSGLLITDESSEVFIGKINNSDEEMIRYRIEQKRGSKLNNFSINPLFNCLSIENIVKILNCILLEKQIIFISENHNEIPYIVEGFLDIIKPL